MGMRLLCLLGLLAGGGTPPAALPDPRVAQHLTAMTRSTPWTQVAAIKLAFRTFHPQGMVRIGADFYLSSVEIRQAPKKLDRSRDGHAYDAGVGMGHLFKIASDGTLLADLRLGEGPIYHPGGIDYDGTSIWVPVAEYRPASRTIVYKVAPATMTATEAFRVADHIGGVVHDRVGHRIIGVDWGSRHFRAWPVAEDGTVSPSPIAVANTESYIDYQDCHDAGDRRMLCSGVADYRGPTASAPFQLGGLELVDLATFRPIWQVPVPLWAPSGRVMTDNPSWVEATASGLRAYFVPDDDSSTVFVFEATPTINKDAAG